MDSQLSAAKGQVNDDPHITDKDSSPPIVQRKKSKLSTVFKIPGTPVKGGSTRGTSESSPGLASSNIVPSSPTPIRVVRTTNPEPVETPLPVENPSQQQTPIHPQIGKGKGQKGDAAFRKASTTQQQIWKTQETMQSLERYLSNNQVLHMFSNL